MEISDISYWDKKQYVIQMDTAMMGILVSFWDDLGQPCTLHLMKPKTAHLTAVVLTIGNAATYEFVKRAWDKIGFRIFPYEGKMPL